MRLKSKFLLKNKFFRGSLILTFTNFIVGFLNYFFNSLTAKTLGPKGYGEITAIFSYSVVLSVPIAVFSADIIRRLGEKGDKKIDAWLTWRDWFLNKLKKYRLLVIPYFILTLFFSKIANLSLLSSFFIIFNLFISFISVFYTAGFQGLHLFSLFSIFSLIAVIIKLAGPIAVYFHLDGINTILMFLILSCFIPLIIVDVIFKKKFNHKPDYQIKNNTLKIISSSSFIFTLFSLIGLNMISNIDVMYVKKFFSAEIAGIYGGWSLLAKIVFYFISALTGIMYIFFSDKEQKTKHRKILFFTIITITLLGLFFFLLYFLFGRRIIMILFNNEFLRILPYASSAAIFGAFYSLLTIINGYFLSKKSRFSLIAVIFIPFYIISLLFFAKTITNVININLLFSGIITLFYFSALWL